jgi:heme oxygenase (biliverdin-IX-beta and delta-forming)
VLGTLSASLVAAAGVERGIAIQLGVQYRAWRYQLLVDDLTAMGISPPDVPLTGEPKSEAAAYGCAYVLEGSALGARVLADRLFQAFGNQLPLTYLQQGSEETGRRWRWFLGELSLFEERSTSSQHDEACQAARAVFGGFLSAFEKHSGAAPG